MKSYKISFLLLCAWLVSCTSPQTSNEKQQLIIGQSTDVSTLNPVSAGDAFSSYIAMHLFQSLLAFDYKTNETVAVLAEDLPTVTKFANGKMHLEYKLKEEAKFDNDKPIVAKDVIFSLKLNIIPEIENLGGSSYYGFIEDIIEDSLNPKKFTIVCANSVVRNLFISGDFMVLPQEAYDANKILSNYSIPQIKSTAVSDSTLLKFAQEFNNSTSDPSKINGSGAYILKKWSPNERLILQRKENWWGTKFKEDNSNFIANAKNIRFEIVTDELTAIAGLKNGQINFLPSISAKNFSKLSTSNTLSKDSVLSFGYSYIGFNLNNKILKKKAVRKAIQSAIPFEKISEIVFKNQGEINRLPVPIQLKDIRNDSINFPEYNLAQAKLMLNSENWISKNQDSILVKDNQPLELNYFYNSGNAEREAVGLMLQNELKQIGIKLNVNSLEWVAYLKALKNGETDLFMSSIISPPLTPDFSMQFHSDMANGGRNYANFKNSEVDSLIELINVENDINKRRDFIYQFQSIIADEIPYVYLFTNQERIAYSTSLENVNIYSLRPNYWAPEIH